MRALILFVALTTPVAVVSEASGAASIAKAPAALRQSYGDGTTTELSCPQETASLEGCVFHTSGPSGTTAYAVAADDYRLEAFLDRYWYWSGNSADSFTVAIPVRCPSIELAKLTERQRDTAECRLFLSPLEGKLVSREVEVQTGE